MPRTRWTACPAIDWVTYKNDLYGVTADLALAIFGGVGEFGDHIAPPFAASPSSILDRFAEVEGLSGTAFTDILRGDNVDATTIVNHGGATGGALTNLGFDQRASGTTEQRRHHDSNG